MTWIMVGMLGVAGGVIAGMFGVGGAIVVVPGLVILAKLPQHAAHGTSLAALLLPVGLLGALEYYKRGYVHVPYALVIAAGLFLGAFVGAKIAVGMPEAVLRRVFGGFLLLVSVRLLL
jgi:uncharacterized membrane protein YfcA